MKRTPIKLDKATGRGEKGKRGTIGKIARLPKDVLRELNRRIQEGQLGPEILPWLNGLPKTKAILKASFGGRKISPANLSDWRMGLGVKIPPVHSGKIQRLSEGVKEELNYRLREGQSGPEILPWLNGLPETKAILRRWFKGRKINTTNLAGWKACLDVKLPPVRKGKIERLPKVVKIELRRRIQGGQLSPEILPWLNGLSKTKDILKASFGGKKINPQNLSEWKACMDVKLPPVRTGKIQRLPAKLQDYIKRRLRLGQSGKQIITWLNGLSETKAVMGKWFRGRKINPENLSQWMIRTGAVFRPRKLPEVKKLPTLRRGKDGFPARYVLEA